MLLFTTLCYLIFETICGVWLACGLWKPLTCNNYNKRLPKSLIRKKLQDRFKNSTRLWTTLWRAGGWTLLQPAAVRLQCLGPALNDLFSILAKHFWIRYANYSLTINYCRYNSKICQFAKLQTPQFKIIASKKSWL